MSQENKTPLLEEVSQNDHVKVDYEAAIIRNVKVLGRESKNRRTYLQESLENVAKLAEGIGVGMNHLKGAESRDALGRNGALTGLYLAEDGVYAKEWQLLKNGINTKQILETADRFPRNFGLSISVPQGAYEASFDDDDRLLVESILSLNSVDLVGDAGTVNSIFESHNPQKETPMKRSDIPEAILTELREEISAELQGDSAQVELSEQVSSLTAERDALSEELAGIKEGLATAEKRDAILAEAEELKAGELSESTLALLLGLEEAQITEQLQERASLVAKSAEGVTHEVETHSISGDVLSKYIK